MKLLMLVRYLFVGGVVFLLDLSCFLFLVKHGGVIPEAAQAISRTVGAAVGFVGHKYFSFAKREIGTKSPKRAESLAQMAGYVGIMIFGIIVSPGVVWILLQFLGNLVVVKFLTEGVMAGINFFLMKVVFLGTIRKTEIES